MGFLNVAMLFGAAAVIVPLGIHLLNRSRYRTVDWAAMHLLAASTQRSTRQVEWRSLLLLLLRCLVPVLLAVCMARPLVRQLPVAAAGGRSTTVLIVDDSFSMQAEARSGRRGDGDEENRSGWDEARASAIAVAEGLGPQAEIALVAMGGPPRALVERPVRDVRPVIGTLDRLAAEAGAADGGEALRMAGGMLLEADEPHRQAVIWSDFQRADWSAQVEAAIAAARRSWQSLAVVPELHLIPVEVAPQPNVSVRFPATASDVALPGEPVPLRIEVENHHDEPVSDLRLALFVDGRSLTTRRMDLAARAIEQFVFTIEWDEPGLHTADVRLEGPTGGITADDRDTIAVTVLPTRTVLLIENERIEPPLENTTGFLELALESASPRGNGGRAVRTRRTTARELDESLVVASDVIVMANVAQLPDEAVTWVATRVAEGAVLCVFAGSRIDRGWYDRQLGPGSPTPLLPMRYGEPAERLPAADEPRAMADVAAGESERTGIEPGPFADPRLAFFDEPQQASLASVVITGWQRLEPWGPEFSDAAVERGRGAVQDGPREQASTAATEVLLRLDHAGPLVVSRTFGTGRVLQWAIAADESSGNLPLQPAYVPLMQRLLLLDLSAATPRASAERRTESSIDPLSAAEITALAGRLAATLHPSAEAFLAYDTDRRGGHEIWRWLLTAVVVTLFAETLLARRPSRGSRR